MNSDCWVPNVQVHSCPENGSGALQKQNNVEEVEERGGTQSLGGEVALEPAP